MEKRSPKAKLPEATAENTEIRGYEEFLRKLRFSKD